jgi:membrane protease YdiL (CAAX protease family)
VLEFAGVTYSQNSLHDRLIRAVVSLGVGFIAVCVIAKWCGVKFFNKPEQLWYMIPCLLVAVNNFQFISFFNGNMSFRAGVDGTAWFLFSAYCVLTGLFEETVFRGIVFPLVAERTSKDKKGLF